jgi:hypothetical protein
MRQESIDKAHGCVYESFEKGSARLLDGLLENLFFAREPNFASTAGQWFSLLQPSPI